MKKFLLTALLLLVVGGKVSAQKGACGPEVTWTLSDSTLTISGTGEMNDVSANEYSYYVYRTRIKHVVIKAGVTSVGCDAFYDYDSLRTVTFEEGVETIGSGAFERCSGIKQVTLPESVKEIEQEAFARTSIESITIPEGLEKIGTCAFYPCLSLTTVNWNAVSCKVAVYTPFGDGRMYIDPGTVTEVNFGPKVKEIRGPLFDYCTTLERVNTSGSISLVAENAFYGTAWFNALPDGLVYIDNALYDYKGVMTEPTSIVVKEGTESITDRAFLKCSYLTDITIPSTLKTMGDNTFDQCPALSQLTWNAIHCTDFEGGPFVDTGLYEVILGNEVTNIPNNMFRGCKMLESIEMSPNVESIGEYAFFDCESLKHVDLPATLQSVGERAFEGCVKLDHVVIPEGVKTLHYGSFWNVKNATYNAIHCEVETFMKTPVFNSLEGFVIGDKVEYIPSYLCGLAKLDNLVIPNSVVEIASWAFGSWDFGDCDTQSLTIGENVKKMECSFGAVKNLTWNAIDMEGKNHVSSTAIEHLTLGDKVKRIPDGLCNNCEQLTEVIIPESVEIIGNAFYNCPGLTEIVVPESVREFSGFHSCANLKSVVWNAIRCESAQLPSAVTTVTLGDKVERIPGNFCYNCKDLAAITLPASVKTISQNAFNNTGLTKLFVPATVSSIDKAAFANNKQLEEVIVASDTVFSVTSPFDNCPKLVSIFVADVPAFSTDKMWSSYSRFLKPMLEFTEAVFVYSGLAPQMPQVNNLIPGHEAQVEPVEMAKDAGTYCVPVVANYTGEHSFSVHVPYTYVIEKAQLVLTPTTTEKVYGDEEPVIEYTATGLVQDETLEQAMEELPVLTALTDARSQVDEYPVVFAQEPVARNYDVSVAPVKFVVNPKQLQVKAEDKVRRYGEWVVYTVVYDGFVNGEDESVLTYLPDARCDAEMYSPVGEYPIHPFGAAARNYTLVYVDGTLRIVKGVQEIEWEQEAQTLYVGDKKELYAWSSSGMPVSFESDNTDVCTVELVDDAYVLVCHSAGVAHITATQPGDDNWEAAEPVVKEFVVSVPVGISDAVAEGVSVSAEQARLHVFGVAKDVPVSVYSLDGMMVHRGMGNGNELVFNVKEGSVYIVRVGNKTFKVVAR